MLENQPLDTEWLEIDRAVEEYFLLFSRPEVPSFEEMACFAAVIAALNNALDHAAIRAQGTPCPEMRAIRSIK